MSSRRRLHKRNRLFLGKLLVGRPMHHTCGASTFTKQSFNLLVIVTGSVGVGISCKARMAFQLNRSAASEV
jgi:hypothetical protein